MTYNEFIQSIIETRGQWNIPEGEYYENHHIIPRCLGGLPERCSHNTKHENLIWLTPKEHFIAHKLLAEENSDNYRLVAAWMMMAFKKPSNSNRSYEITPEEYEELRILWVNSCKSEEFRKVNSDSKFKFYAEGGKPWNYGLTKEINESIKNQSEKLKVKYKGENNPMHNYKLTEEQHSHYRNAALKREKDPELKKKKSDKLKLIRATTCPAWNSVKVKCIETNEVFSSMSKACKFIGINGTDKLRLACEDSSKTFGNYHWEYADN